MISVKKVESKKELKAFIDLPHDIYEGDPFYVPELFIAQRDLLTPGKHPFHQHSKLDLFLAYQDGKPVGRIAAIRNNNYMKFTGKNDGFYGFFDTYNDYNIAKKLYETVEQWARKEKFSNLMGPVNFSTNETCGMLVEGFDSSPVVMMTFNKPYYNDFTSKFGFKKKMDLIAWKLTAGKVADKAVRIKEAIEARLKNKGITIRKANMKDFAAEVKKLLDIYNSAWESNWGFVPMTDEEFVYSAKDMKMILDPDLVLVAEHNGKVVAFSLTLPDINQALKHVKRGRLFPTGLLKLLYYKGKVDTVRVIALGVQEPYRKLGIEACFYASTILSCKAKNIHTAEASWILENNVMMNQGIENLNGDPYKKYRLYELALS